MRSLLLVFLCGACSHHAQSQVPPDPGVEPIDVGRDLSSVLQYQDTHDACQRYQAGHKDRRTTLLCGKWLFFYETFGTTGVPSAIPKFLIKEFPDEIGPGFEKLGMIADPNLPDGLPVGLVPGRRVGLASAVAFTCASCHFTRLPDGRYAVGGANHDYQFGKQLLAMTLLPTLALMGKAEDHDPDAVAFLQPMLDRIKEHPELKGRMALQLLKVLPAFKAPKLDRDIEHAYASWPPGTMDFLFPPMKIDDHVNVVTKILPLWGLPTFPQIAQKKMPHAMLGWSGAAPSTMEFVRSFIRFADGDDKEWTEERLQPLVDYLSSLRAPQRRERGAVSDGAALFREKGCAHCHDGPGFGGRRVFTFEEIGTDDALERYLDPDKTGKPCCKAPLPDNALTHGVKSPRLIGLWTQKRFLHNGSLGSLEELFCLGKGRPEPSGLPGLDPRGHDFTCRLPTAEKEALIRFLEVL